MSLSSRRELTASTTARYRSADKKAKGVILAEFVYSTVYERKYAISVLNQPAVAPQTRRLGVHRYPLARSVGDSIVRYLKEARPQSGHREIFLTLIAPFRPITSSTVYPIVASRLRPIAGALKHHGPHALRHSCATHLLDEGHSLKEVGDHLGHRNTETTRIYAKVNLAALQEVAKFDLGGLL